MGKIIRNGIEFSSTVDTANNISYDNSLSGLEATTAQKAIDEVCEGLGKDENGMTLHEKLDALLNSSSIVKDFYNLNFMGDYKSQNVKYTITLSRDFAKGTFLFVSGNVGSGGGKVIVNDVDITSSLTPLRFAYMGDSTSSAFGLLRLPPEDLELHAGDIVTCYHTGGGSQWEGIVYQ